MTTIFRYCGSYPNFVSFVIQVCKIIVIVIFATDYLCGGVRLKLKSGLSQAESDAVTKLTSLKVMCTISRVCSNLTRRIFFWVVVMERNSLDTVSIKVLVLLFPLQKSKFRIPFPLSAFNCHQCKLHESWFIAHYKFLEILRLHQHLFIFAHGNLFSFLAYLSDTLFALMSISYSCKNVNV